MKNGNKKTIKKLFTALAISILMTAFWVIGVITAREGMTEYYSKATHDFIKKNYLDTKESYVFVSESDDAEESIRIINTIFDKLPSSFSEYIKSNWLILVSSENPYQQEVVLPFQNAVVAGTTHYDKRIIWLKGGFSEKVFAHEVGHVIASILGGIDRSEAFYNLYNTVAQKYVEYGENEINPHSTSNAIEFFAVIFEEYICYPKYLKENFIDGHNYVAAQLKKEYRASSWGKWISSLIRFCNVAKENLREQNVIF